MFNGLRRGPVALAACGLALGLFTGYAILTSPHLDHRGLEAALALIIGWGFVGCGVHAWSRRPDNNFGPLMAATGLLFFVSELAASGTAIVFTVASLFGNLFFGVLIHMLLAMPSGRLRSRGERAVVVAVYAFTSPLSRSYLLFLDPQANGCGGCPENLALVDADAGTAHAIDTVINVLALVMVVVVLALLVRHWHEVTGAARRAVQPVLLTGAAALTLLGIGLVGQLAGRETVAELGYYATQAAILPLPFAFLAALARGRLLRGDAVRRLVGGLRAASEPREARDALADALGDPSLELVLWLPDYRTYAGLDGEPVALDGDREDGRAVTPIDSRGAPLAALIHDPALLDDPELLDSVAAAAAIALENVRLNVELRARLDELRGSRSRLVEAGDAERRRLERDLHDGAQSRMVGVALQLRLMRDRIRRDPDAAEQLLATASEELAMSLTELRELARGIHPAVLEHGLEPALASLASRSPVPTTVSYEPGDRLPPAVELAAYFVVCEALANVAKYADASEARVRVWREGAMAGVEISDDGVGGADDSLGSGLRGLADRVEALDGRLAVTSPAGAGTVGLGADPLRVLISRARRRAPRWPAPPTHRRRRPRRRATHASFASR